MYNQHHPVPEYPPIPEYIPPTPTAPAPPKLSGGTLRKTLNFFSSKSSFLDSSSAASSQYASQQHYEPSYGQPWGNGQAAQTPFQAPVQQQYQRPAQQLEMPEYTPQPLQAHPQPPSVGYTQMPDAPSATPTYHYSSPVNTNSVLPQYSPQPQVQSVPISTYPSAAYPTAASIPPYSPAVSQVSPQPVPQSISQPVVHPTLQAPSSYTPPQPQLQPPPTGPASGISGASPRLEELETLRRKLTECHNKIASKIAEHLNAQTEVTRLTRVAAENTDELSRVKQQLQGAAQTIQELQSELNEVRSRTQDKDTELAQVTQELTQLQSHIEAVHTQSQEQLVSMQQQLMQAQQEGQMLRTNAEANHRLASDKDIEIVTVRTEMMDLNANFSLHGQEIELVKLEAEQKFVNAETSHRQVVAEKDQQIAGARLEIQRLETTGQTQGQELERLKLEVDGLRKTPQQINTTTSIEELRRELQTLKATVTQKDAEIARLNQLLSASQSTLPTPLPIQGFGAISAASGRDQNTTSTPEVEQQPPRSNYTAYTSPTQPHPDQQESANTQYLGPDSSMHSSNVCPSSPQSSTPVGQQQNYIPYAPPTQPPQDHVNLQYQDPNSYPHAATPVSHHPNYTPYAPSTQPPQFQQESVSPQYQGPGMNEHIHEQYQQSLPVPPYIPPGQPPPSQPEPINSQYQGLGVNSIDHLSDTNVHIHGNNQQYLPVPPYIPPSQTQQLSNITPAQGDSPQSQQTSSNPQFDLITGAPDQWSNENYSHSSTSLETPINVPEEDLDTETAVSPSEKEWERLRKIDGEDNIAMDFLIRQWTGMENVKAYFLNVKAKIDTAVRQGVSLHSERYDLAIVGNPGTGKSDVAKLYHVFLSTYANIVPKTPFLEATGQSLLAKGGISAAREFLNQFVGFGGGYFWVDDVHVLTESEDGVKLLDYLVGEMTKKPTNTVFVFVGTNKAIENHAGLASRIPNTLQLEDYTDREFQMILCREIINHYNSRMRVEGGMGGLYMRIVARRLGRCRGSASFANVRELQKTFATIRHQQGARLNRERSEGLDPDDFYFTKEDLIGPNPSQAIRKSEAWKQLQGLIGLESVKQSVRGMIDMIENNYVRELQEKPPLEISLNRVFLGSPGTGKTTVAKLYGRILADLGLLSNGEVVVKSPADFMGNYLGQTENKTKAILASAIGKVLIIDESYGFYPDTSVGAETDIYKTAAIDTIVAEIQSTPGEDRCVLLLGYEEELNKMFQNVNPGLARRFAIENAFVFQDFTEEELQQVLELKLKQQGLQATVEAKQVVREVLTRSRRRPNFGNGGEVENIISQAKVRYQTRIATIPVSQRLQDVVFEPQDFDPEFARGVTAAVNCRKLFEGMVGCEEVIAKLEGYQKIAANAKAAGIELHKLIPTNFLFKGPPGTGKTMTARKMGKVFYDMGFLASDKVVECSASDLIGIQVGQTGPKTQKLFEKALGQVLFIDEAYRLGDTAGGGYGQDAISEMVDLLTKPNIMGKMIVILAGYVEPMNALLAANQGLSSRFPEEIIFRHMPPVQCVELLRRDIEVMKISAPFLMDPNCQPFRDICNVLASCQALPYWANARDVQTLAKAMVSEAYRQPGQGFVPVLQPAEAMACVSRLLQERQDRAARLEMQ